MWTNRKLGLKYFVLVFLKIRECILFDLISVCTRIPKRMMRLRRFVARGSGARLGICLCSFRNAGNFAFFATPLSPM
jgi:hypothetical protein